MALPPGFRFHPTDEELVAYYLKRKVAGRSIEFNIITEIDLYKQEPWDLPEKSFLPGSDMEWYFFSPRDKKYPNGLRTNRATEAGYWKATGKDRNVKKAGRVVGMKKTLVFYRGRAPHGERTDWVMHEYRLDEEECQKVHASQDLFVLCRVFKKSGVGPRSGEDRGPQTYVDDDVDKEPSGSFADAVKKALDPTESTPSLPASVATVEPLPAPLEEAPKADTTEKSPSTGSTLSVDDYSQSGIIDAQTEAPLEDLMLQHNFETTVEDGQYWDCFDLPSIGMDPASQQFPSSDLTWQADVNSGAHTGMMWNSDLSNSAPDSQCLELEECPPELEGPNEELGFMDMLQMELLEQSDDILPPLVEELESNNLGDSSLPNLVDGNQQLSGRGPARARSRAARQQPTSEEAQQRARGSNDGVYRSNPTFQQLMSNMNFRGPEVQSHAGESSTSSHVGSSSNNFDSNQASSSAHASGSGISGVPLGEDNLFSFQDCLLDFPLDDELFNMASGYESEDLSPNDLNEDVEGSDVNVSEPVKPAESSQSAASEDSPRQFLQSQEGPLGDGIDGKPLSKPLAGLMKLLGSMPALPASAAECSPDTKPLHLNGELGSSYSAIHLSAVTVTCTSSADGGQKVQAAVTSLQGDAKDVYQQVASGSWQTQQSETLKPLCVNCDTAAVNAGLQRRVARGSNSGFVFVFALGAVSALCWFLLLRIMWRLGTHVLTSVF